VAALQLLSALVLFLVVAAAGTLLVQSIFRPADAAPALAPSRAIVAAGLVLALLAPSLHALVARPPPWLPPAALLLFVLGWLLTCVGLRPRRQPDRGLVLGLLTYEAAGLLWIALFNLTRGAPLSGILHPIALFFALYWPLQVAQIVGLFGLSMD
jgi:hypothetical protein